MTASFAEPSGATELTPGAAREAEFSTPEANEALGSTVGAAGCKAVVTFESRE